jgi:hypothetical protein
MQWVKGQSGSPSGLPKGKTLAQQCRENTGRVIQRPTYWLEQDDNPSASIRAAEILLDRGYDKPVLPVADGAGHSALKIDPSDMTMAELRQAERVMQSLIRRSVDIIDIDVPDVTTIPAKISDPTDPA